MESVDTDDAGPSRASSAIATAGRVRSMHRALHCASPYRTANASLGAYSRAPHSRPVPESQNAHNGPLSLFALSDTLRPRRTTAPERRKEKRGIGAVVRRGSKHMVPLGPRRFLLRGADSAGSIGVANPSLNQGGLYAKHYSTSPVAACVASLYRFRDRDRGFTRVGGTFGFSRGVRLHLFRGRRRDRWPGSDGQAQGFRLKGPSTVPSSTFTNQGGELSGLISVQGTAEGSASGGITPQDVLSTRHRRRCRRFGIDGTCSGICG